MRYVCIYSLLPPETDSRYPYIDELIQLQHPPSATPLGPVVGTRGDYFSPLRPVAWAEALRGHPDPRFAEFLVQGLEAGFRIGFSRACPLVSVG